MRREQAVPRRFRARTRCAVPCLALLVVCASARAEELVVTRADVPAEVGARTTLAMMSPEGRRLVEFKLATIGRRTLGKATLLRESVVVGQTRVRDSWVALSDREYATYSSFGAKHPTWKCPLPLRAGLTYEYESDTGPARARVGGPEEIEVPAGRFNCLVCVEEREVDGKRTKQKRWIARGVGGVKMVMEGDRDVTVSLASREEPRRVEAPEGVDVMCTFDVSDPLGSPLFPKAVWTGLAGLPGRASVVDIEPTGGAAGPPFCMKWTY
ncbi:MAG: hypothetical protein ACYS9X_21535, partial [Planctomycetota bacterium]